MRLEKINILTATGGAFTGYTVPTYGLIQQLAYVPDGTSPLDTGADFVITGETTGLPILTKANIGTSLVVFAPRQPTHALADGAALLYAALGAAVNDRIAVVNERIKLVIAAGGDAKAGILYIWLEDGARQRP